MPRTLITGGAGFLGSHLCEYLLNKGHQVICMDNLLTGNIANIEHLQGENFKFIKHDVTEYIFIAGEIDYILHFASPASPIDYMQLPIQTLKVGSMGTHKALGLAKEKKATFLLASTSEVYGDPLVHPQPEEYWGNVNTIGPRSCYDEGKRCAETLFFDYHRQNNVNIRVVRIFNTYGPRMHPRDGRVISNFIVQALTSKDITVYGDGTQTRSFCYVDDMVEGMVRMMNGPDNFIGPVNLGNPDELSILDIAKMIIDLTGSTSKIIFEPLPQDDPVQRQPDITLARENLGWEPKLDIETGLKRTIEYFRKIL